MSALLIFTVGHTDVQLVVEGQRWELDKQRTSELHAELAQREADWKLVEAPERRSRTSWPAARCQEGALLPPGELALCTPKLEAVLHWCQEHGHQPAHALILHTDRAARRDPTQAGPIVQRRLGEQGGVAVSLVSYLSHEETLEDRRVPQDALVRREIVTRLEGAIVEELARSGATTLVVAAAGGFPEVSALVRELAALHSEPGAVHDLDVPDSSRAGGAFDVASERKQPTDPSAVVAAKRHALALVKGGSFIAAWGAVAHLHDDAAGCPWTRVVRWLYLWASSLPLDEGDEPCTLPFPGKEQRAANAAMRVELALRCGDIPRAVQGTVAFFEAAVWDYLHAGPFIEHISSTGTGKRARFRLTPEPVGCEAIVKKPKTAPDNAYVINNYGKFSLKIIEDYLAHQSFPSAAIRAMVAPIDEAFSLRNAVAHGEPTREEVERMAVAMGDLQLWSNPAVAQPGPPRFLGQPLVDAVLTELGVRDPSNLCNSLIQAALERLRVLTNRSVAGTA